MSAVREMSAVRAHAEGGPEALTFERAPVPPLGYGDVLVRVEAASFTPTELGWPSTWTDRTGRSRLPTIPGHEVSGIVEELGGGTTGAAVGDEVFGLTDWYRDGSAAEFVAVELRNLAPKPASVDHVQAAAAPLAGLTAWQALFVHGKLEGDQTVLIHGAAGGVGIFAVQLAKAAGARVIAGGRAAGAEVATGLGADAYLDLDREGPEKAAAEADLVIDMVGGGVLARTAESMRDGTILVSVADDPPARDGVEGVYFIVEPDRAHLSELARRIDAGEVRPIVGDVRPLSDAGEAFATKRRGGLPGKSVLRVGD
jgi:NADPH:quinone reductase-like Zn-dependent oxidoreductase